MYLFNVESDDWWAAHLFQWYEGAGALRPHPGVDRTRLVECLLVQPLKAGGQACEAGECLTLHLQVTGKTSVHGRGAEQAQ